MESFLLLHLYFFGMTTAFAFCMWFVWNGARSLVKHEALRKEFKTASMLRDVAVIMFAGVAASVTLVLAETFFEYIALESDSILYGLVLVMTSAFILIAIVSRVHGVFSKLKWAIEMDRLQKLSGILMTSAQPTGTSSKMFSVYREDNHEPRSFTIRDESVVEKLRILLDQRVVVFYAAPSGEGNLSVACFVASAER